MRHRFELSRVRCLTLLVVVLTATALGASRSSGQSEAFRLKERMSAAEFEKCGLQKLTPSELAALETWLARQGDSTASSPASGIQRFQSGAASPHRVSDEMVAFNTSSHKYHCASCRSALQCTRNCISIPLSQARQRGTPCSVCGGSCR